MKRIMLLAVVGIFAMNSSVYAQSVARLGMSSVRYNSKVLDKTHESVWLGTEGSWYYAGTRLDFDRHSMYWNIAQLEFGPKFLRAGPGIVMGNPDKRSNQLRVNFSATFNPWRGLYLNARWAPVSLNNRPNHKNFFDASIGWQFKL